MQSNPSNTQWCCTHCGPSPTSRANWCDRGCGSDYNQMFELVTEPTIWAAIVREREAMRRVVAGARAFATPIEVGAINRARDYLVGALADLDYYEVNK